MSLPIVALAVDVNGVGVVLPEIAADLDLGPAARSWVMNASPLAMAAVLIVVGRYVDRRGRRIPLLVGIAGFGVGSLVCALAPGSAVLIGGRVFQGLASAVCFTTSLAVVTEVFDAARRDRAIGIWGAVMGVGGAVGPLVGGALTTSAGWRGFFAVNVVLCLVVVPLLSRWVPADRSTPGATDPRPRDGWMLATGLALVMLGAQAASRTGWLAPAVLGPMLLGAALLGCWRRLDRASAVHLLPVTADVRTFRSANAVGACANWAFGIALVFGAAWLQEAAGLSAFRAGVVFVSFSGAFALGGVVLGRVEHRVGRAGALAVGSALGAAGLGLTTTIDAGGGLAGFVVGLVVSGFGLGVVFDASTAVGVAAVGDAAAGTAAGILQTTRLVGMVVGIAVSTWLLHEAATGTDAVARLTSGTRAVLALGAVVSALGAVIAVTTRPRGLPWRPPEVVDSPTE